MAEHASLRNLILYHIRTSRPRFWLYLFGPYMLGIIAGYSGFNTTKVFQSVALALFFLLPANYFLYGINDIFDFETDKLNAKKTGYETIATPDRRNQIWLLMITLTIPWWWIFREINNLSFAFIVGFLGMGGAYSAPPIRAKVRPFLDALSNVFYIFPGLIGFSLWQNRLPEWRYILAGGLWCVAMHAFSAVPDITADIQSGIKTIATTLGKNKTIFFCAIAYITSGLLLWHDIEWFCLVIIAPYALFMWKAWQEESLRGVFRLYTQFPKINTLVGMILTILLLSEAIRR